MNIRNCKIARLPLHIREQLNTRLFENEPVNHLVDWLNAQPEVNAVMDSLFQGSPISEQSISEWKSGAHLAWVVLNSCVDHSHLVAEGAEHVAGTGIGAEQLLQIITARFAELLQTMDVAPEIAFTRRMLALERLAKSALALRKCEQQDSRIELERERLELQREKQRNKSASSTASPASSSESAPTQQRANSSAAPSPVPPAPNALAVHPPSTAIATTAKPSNTNQINGSTASKGEQQPQGRPQLAPNNLTNRIIPPYPAPIYAVK